MQRTMAPRREQTVEQVEQSAGNPVIEEKRQEAPSSDPVHARQRESPGSKGTKTHHLDPRLKRWTNMNSRTLCSVPGADTVFRAGQGKIHIDALQQTRVGHQRSCWIGCSSRVIKSRVVNCLCWFGYHLSTGNAVNEGFVCGDSCGLWRRRWERGDTLMLRYMLSRRRNRG